MLGFWDGQQLHESKGLTDFYGRQHDEHIRLHWEAVSERYWKLLLNSEAYQAAVHQRRFYRLAQSSVSLCQPVLRNFARSEPLIETLNRLSDEAYRLCGELNLVWTTTNQSDHFDTLSCREIRWWDSASVPTLLDVENLVSTASFTGMLDITAEIMDRSNAHLRARLLVSLSNYSPLSPDQWKTLYADVTRKLETSPFGLAQFLKSNDLAAEDVAPSKVEEAAHMMADRGVINVVKRGRRNEVEGTPDLAKVLPKILLA